MEENLQLPYKKRGFSSNIKPFSFLTIVLISLIRTSACRPQIIAWCIHHKILGEKREPVACSEEKGKSLRTSHICLCSRDGKSRGNVPRDTKRGHLHLVFWITKSFRCKSSCFQAQGDTPARVRLCYQCLKCVL